MCVPISLQYGNYEVFNDRSTAIYICVGEVTMIDGRMYYSMSYMKVCLSVAKKFDAPYNSASMIEVMRNQIPSSV